MSFHMYPAGAPSTYAHGQLWLISAIVGASATTSDISDLGGRVGSDPVMALQVAPGVLGEAPRCVMPTTSNPRARAVPFGVCSTT